MVPAAQTGRETEPAKMFLLQDAMLMEKTQLVTMSPHIADMVATADRQHAAMSTMNMKNTDVSIMLVHCMGYINLMPCM